MINEVSPPGWGHTKAEKEKTKPEKPKSKIGGTAHAMKLAQKRGDIPKNMNIFAWMWSMKNKGDKPHYKPGVKDKLKGKYKGPEGQNEMIDPKKIRNYKNVSNAVVAKADKEAEKVKDKEQKGTLEFPQMPTEESTEPDEMIQKVVEYIKTNGARRKTDGGDGRRTGNHVSITPAGKKALKKGDQKLSITKKGVAALKKGDRKEDYVSDFGNKLRQAIEEAKKVNAIDTINKIVKTKTMGKLHGQKVDLFTASAIQQVYNALNKKNQEKMISVMSKDVHGLLKMADFSMKQMKR